MQVEQGTLIDGRYRIVRQIGEGGMATVYEAENSRLGNRFALKFMAGALQHSRTGVDRFLREAATLAQLKHPHIVQVFDVVDFNGVPVIVMELLHGETLANRVDNGWRPNSQQLTELAVAMLDALNYAHASGFVHRDIKPDNIFAEHHHGGRVVWRLMDFGIARNAVDHGLTSTGQFIGTRRYASPEQIQDPRGVDHRADLFSLGVTLWEATTGMVPWEKVDSEFEMMKAITTYPEYSVSERGLDPRLETLVRALTCNDRNRRLPSAAVALGLLGAPTSPASIAPHTGPHGYALPRIPPSQAYDAPHLQKPGYASQPAQHPHDAFWAGPQQTLQPHHAWMTHPNSELEGMPPQSGFWAGRLSRGAYFGRMFGWGFLLYLGLGIGAVLIDEGDLVGSGAMILLGVALILAAMCALAPMLQAYIRRLHDIGHGGSTALLYVLGNLIPGIGFFVGLYVLFTPGMPGPNKYGPPPK
jgi:serine/threonine protein kinase/uncharacterized membrane protein YhaH (DUF805 family)